MTFDPRTMMVLDIDTINAFMKQGGGGNLYIPETEEISFSKNIEQERQRDLDLELSEIRAKLRKLNS